MAGEGRAGIIALHRAFLQSGGLVLQPKSCCPPSRAVRDCSPAGQGLELRSGEEEQAELREGTALLSLWQPASDGELLPSGRGYATEQPGAACKALLIDEFPAEWQTHA